MTRKPVTAAQIGRAIEARIKELREREASFKQHNGHPQILEMLYHVQGGIGELNDVLEMIRDKREKPACW